MVTWWRCNKNKLKRDGKLTVELKREVVINIFGIRSRFKTELNSSASLPANSYKPTELAHKLQQAFAILAISKKSRTNLPKYLQEQISINWKLAEQKLWGSTSSSGLHTVSSNSLVFSMVRGIFLGGGCTKITSHQINSYSAKKKNNNPNAILQKGTWPPRRARERASLRRHGL